MIAADMPTAAPPPDDAPPTSSRPSTAILARRLGRPAAVVRLRRRRTRSAGRSSPDADGEIVGTGVATINGPVGWIGTIWVDAGVARAGPRPALTAGDDRRGRGGRLPHARPRRDRRRPAALRAARLRGPDLVPDPRGARTAARGEPGRSAVRAVPSRRDLAAMAALDARRPARTGRTCWRAFAAPDTTRVPRSARTARSAASSSGRRGAAARRSRRDRATPRRSCDARRVATGSDGARPRRAPAENEAGLERLLGRRLDRGLAGPAADPRRAARLAARRDLGPVQPRPGLTRSGAWIRARTHADRWSWADRRRRTAMARRASSPVHASTSRIGAPSPTCGQPSTAHAAASLRPAARGESGADARPAPTTSSGAVVSRRTSRGRSTARARSAWRSLRTRSTARPDTPARLEAARSTPRSCGCGGDGRADGHAPPGRPVHARVVADPPRPASDRRPTGPSATAGRTGTFASMIALACLQCGTPAIRDDRHVLPPLRPAVRRAAARRRGAADLSDLLPRPSTTTAGRRASTCRACASTSRHHMVEHDRHPVGDDEWLETLREGDRSGGAAGPRRSTPSAATSSPGRSTPGRNRQLAHDVIVTAMTQIRRWGPNGDDLRRPARVEGRAGRRHRADGALRRRSSLRRPAALRRPRRPAGAGTPPRRGPGRRAPGPWPAWSRRSRRRRGSRSSSTPSRRACRRRRGSPPRPPAG